MRDTQEYHRRRRREQAKDHRKEFWKSLRAAEADPTEEQRVRLRTAVTTWVLSLAELERAAGRHAALAALWRDVDLGEGKTGLYEFKEDTLRETDETVPLDHYRAAGVALNNAAIILWDLPPQPPIEAPTTVNSVLTLDSDLDEELTPAEEDEVDQMFEDSEDVHVD